jgi:rfaE bifunctional protein kinase chain/domain
MNSSLNTSLEQLHVIVIGDLILDHYLMGTVDRISPEAPVPVVLHQQELYRLGGAANVAMNVKAMGASPHLIGTIGDDEEGRQLLACLEQSNIDISGIISDQQLQTTTKTRVMARNQQLLRYDKERIVDMGEDLCQKILQQIEKVVEEYEVAVIIFQDYNKGVLVKEIIKGGMKIAVENKIPSLVDPKKNNFWEYTNSTLFKPNLKEIQEASSLIIDASPSLNQLNQAALEIIERIGVTTVLITLGAAGIYAYHDGEGLIVPTQKRAIADVCGAGDTVISLLAIAMAIKLPLLEMLRLSNIGGGQVCEEVGVVPINKEKLLKEYLE